MNIIRMSITIESEEQFYELLDSKDYLMVDFFATWCRPCMEFADSYEDLANENKEVNFLKVDIDDFPELQEEFQVEKLPTFLTFKKANHTPIDRIIGPKTQLIKGAIHSMVGVDTINDDF